MKTIPPATLPSVTGIWFHSHQSASPTRAPSSMPAGTTNMFTTECSKPWAKNVMIGSHIAAIFPAVDCDVNAMTTPRVTIQLQRIARPTAMATPWPPSRS